MLTLSTGRFAAILVAVHGLAALPAFADDSGCVTYATDYANSHMGSGDVVGDAVDGGMAGAVAGGAWQGPSGAVRGARAGAALGVLDNMGSMPGGWQALYDMAYQMCQQQVTNANIAPLGSPNLPSLPPPSSDCRSSASVNAPLKKAPDGSIMAGSGLGNCP